ncbi:MAG TPA: hypothetical protein VKT78_15820 [Fimbriimonadaceae bacterium]|nr:hypothetical protein [Fimbriimonadaceae bacterium]
MSPRLRTGIWILLGLACFGCCLGGLTVVFDPLGHMQLDKIEARLKRDLAGLPAGSDEAAVRLFAEREGLMEVGQLSTGFNRDYPPSPPNAVYEMSAEDRFQTRDWSHVNLVVRFRFDKRKRFISGVVDFIGCFM